MTLPPQAGRDVTPREKNVRRPFPFVLSSTRLVVRTKRIIELIECIVLLLLTCLRLYGFAVSMFGGVKGTEAAV